MCECAEEGGGPQMGWTREIKKKQCVRSSI